MIIRKLAFFVAIPLAILISILCGLWIYHNMEGKAKYDRGRKEMAFTYKVVPYDKEFDSFMSEVESTWTCKSNTADGPCSGGIKSIGMIPSVDSLLYLMNSPMPDWSWFSSNENAASLGLAKSVLLPVSVDKSIHLTDDKHTAVILISKSYIAVFKDDKKGLREIAYRKERVKDNGVEPSPSEDKGAFAPSRR